MLQGEIEACRAKDVLLCSSLAGKEQHNNEAGTEGLLVITNFKLSFITYEDSQVSCGWIFRVGESFVV